MKILKTCFSTALVLWAVAIGAQAQQAVPSEDWHLKAATDKIVGIGAEEAYQEFLSKKAPKRTVVVAVIDSGIEIDHEDLKDNIWTNEKEIAGNGIDDDGNGYVDDVFGWNFIGGPDSTFVDQDTYELTREFIKLSARFADVEEGSLKKKKDKEAYQYYQEIADAYQAKQEEAETGYNNYIGFLNGYERATALLTAYFNTPELVMDSVRYLSSPDPVVQNLQQLMLYVDQMGITAEDLEDGAEYFEGQLKYGYNLEFDPRHIVGDNYDDKSERYYGNPYVQGPDAEHGTHVAGIIGAVRGNDLGMDGVAEQVKIMTVRAVPDGDERDKDVANAIYYAVDNGAHIINMSFGKAYSPYKDVVDEAVRYAEKKGVLLVHAAGNDGKNLEIASNFPNRRYMNSKKEAKNWIEVGASAWGGEKGFVASFSNYGQNTVDLFAPGVDIYSSVPASDYKRLNGTSMAAPVVSGVAAVLMAYYPELSAEEVKQVLMDSARKFREKTVTIPGEEDQTTFGKLSISGGVVNLYEAVKMLEAKGQ